jgi:hypothetical protein
MPTSQRKIEPQVVREQLCSASHGAAVTQQLAVSGQNAAT